MFLIKKKYILYLQEKNEGIFDEGLDLSFNNIYKLVEFDFA